MAQGLVSPSSRLRLPSPVLDRIEQVVAVVLYSLLVARVWPDDWSAASAWSMVLLVSEGAVPLFLVIRRPTARISVRGDDWAIAAAGTFLPLLVAPGGEPISVLAGAALLLVGTFVHIGAKLSLNRSFGLVAANRGVKQDGLYRLVRHPMYAGYMLTHAGFGLLHPNLRNVVAYAATWTIIVLRIRAEERVLAEDPGYQAFAARVRFRLLPWVY